MKTTEQYFQEFYNEVRYQIEQGSKANFTRANQIWAEYEAAQQNAHLTLWSRPVFCVCCGGEVSHPVCTDCLPSPAQVA